MPSYTNPPFNNHLPFRTFSRVAFKDCVMVTSLEKDKQGHTSHAILHVSKLTGVQNYRVPFCPRSTYSLSHCYLVARDDEVFLAGGSTTSLNTWQNLTTGIPYDEHIKDNPYLTDGQGKTFDKEYGIVSRRRKELQDKRTYVKTDAEVKAEEQAKAEAAKAKAKKQGKK